MRAQLKQLIRYYAGDLFLTRRFYGLLAGLSVVFVLRFFIPALGPLPFILLAAAAAAVGVEYGLLFFGPGKVTGSRRCPERFSNGDDNGVVLALENSYPFGLRLGIIDEIPRQFQRRDVYFPLFVPGHGKRELSYRLRPVERGDYLFGTVRVYAATRIGCVERRFIVAGDRPVKVYPAFLRLRTYRLLAEANRWSAAGIRRRRQLGHSMEFEQIKTYVPGDDYRTVNWKATARAGNWMVNNYIEEKSQQIYCVIDKGRAMKMPFEGLSLLDYAVNASLVLSDIAIRNQDAAGLVTFSDRIGSFLAADKKAGQMQHVLETLYHQQTAYPESDFERLYIAVSRHIAQRSLLVLFTNFGTLSALRRQEPYLRRLATRHLVLVVIFENTELRGVLEDIPEAVADVYTQVIAERFTYEKKLILRELHSWGLAAILSPPARVTVDALNKYLELKATQAL